MRVLLLLSLALLATPAVAQIGMVPETKTGIALAEAAVRAKLKDPDSAKFEWPHQFMNGHYRIPFGKKVEGWLTCGTVNARNGYGGYGGRMTILAAVRDGVVVNVDMDEPDENLVSSYCAKLGMPVR